MPIVRDYNLPEVYNPRFPHTFQVLRPTVNEYGDPVFDENGDPSYSPIPLYIVEYRRYLPLWERVKDDQFLVDEDGAYVLTEAGERIIVGFTIGTRLKVFTSDRNVFGYRQQTANAVISGDVIIAEMKMACPMMLQEIRTGDILELTDRDRTFRAKVIKKTNTNFGTNIWYNEIKQ